VTISINLGAYASEIVRAGIEAVPHGRTEAARSLGLRPPQIYRKIVIPPALRNSSSWTSSAASSTR
jgi:polar amino acid transport system permease protein